MAAIAAWVLRYRVPESRDETNAGTVDVRGAVVATVGLAAVTYGFIEVPEHGFHGPAIPIFLGLGVVCLVAFPFVERSVEHPMVSLDLFRSRTFSGANVLTFLLYGALSGALFFFPLNLIQVQQYPAVVAGLTLFPVVVAMATLSTWAGSLADRFGARVPLTVGPLIVAIGFVLLARPSITRGPTEYWTAFFLPVLLLGIGMAVTSTPLTTAVMGSVSAHRAGIASGVNNAVTRTAGVLAIAVMGAFMLHDFRRSLGDYAAHLELAEPVYTALLAGAGDLGNTRPPDGLDAETTNAVGTAIKLAFVDAFRRLNWISAALCGVSALCGWLAVDDRPAQP